MLNQEDFARCYRSVTTKMERQRKSETERVTDTDRQRESERERQTFRWTDRELERVRVNGGI